MNHFTPYSALIGGSLIGLSATLLLLLSGKIAGVSSIMKGLFKPPYAEIIWRATFLAGLVASALMIQMFVPELIHIREDYPLWWVAVGGFLVGFGTRLGSGCTSGHGICGIANGSLRSIYATLAFMSSGFLTVFLIHHVFQ